MIANQQQFQITLEHLAKFLEGLEVLQQTVLPTNPTLYRVLAESAIEDIRRLRTELQDFESAWR